MNTLAAILQQAKEKQRQELLYSLMHMFLNQNGGKFETTYDELAAYHKEQQRNLEFTSNDGKLTLTAISETRTEEAQVNDLRSAVQRVMDDILGDIAAESETEFKEPEYYGGSIYTHAKMLSELVNEADLPKRFRDALAKGPEGQNAQH
ncbi:hypothetical protein vBAcoSR7M_63 [Alteromonas phage vB_AcoS-R7M]|uniref:Uncharacterized protein n=1 Tax=Alteromonas phage vB_AcoS-R7M TaxID=2729541 RepID=A0A6M3YNG3_9CAUD|nr:hypothetical protein HWD34_gp63 [Alteromonas phage vB_AcoS-R7M]QJI53385.1 hypothetical protein vBAcoSR7M_63 [Alteromonas phage vB_AcoS-R7M]